MGLNKKCPKCGSGRCELRQDPKSHWFLKYVLFGAFYVGYLVIKLILALMILFVLDWWFGLLMKAAGKHYLWVSKSLLKKRRTYYCHECGYNFRA